MHTMQASRTRRKASWTSRPKRSSSGVVHRHHQDRDGHGWSVSTIDDIASSGSDLLLVVEAQGPLAGVPIVLFSVLLLLQGHRRLPVTAFAIGAAAGYVLAPNLLAMLASVGVESPLDMAQSQRACAAIIGIMMVSVAQASLRMMAGLLAFIGITAGVPRARHRHRAGRIRPPPW